MQSAHHLEDLGAYQGFCMLAAEVSSETTKGIDYRFPLGRSDSQMGDGLFQELHRGMHVHLPQFRNSGARSNSLSRTGTGAGRHPGRGRICRTEVRRGNRARDCHRSHHFSASLMRVYRLLRRALRALRRLRRSAARCLDVAITDGSYACANASLYGPLHTSLS